MPPRTSTSHVLALGSLRTKQGPRMQVAEVTVLPVCVPFLCPEPHTERPLGMQASTLWPQSPSACSSCRAGSRECSAVRTLTQAGLTCAGLSSRSSALAGPIPGPGRSAAPGPWRRWRASRSRAGRSGRHPSSSPHSGRLGSSWLCLHSGATRSGISLGSMKKGRGVVPQIRIMISKVELHVLC